MDGVEESPLNWDYWRPRVLFAMGDPPHLSGEGRLGRSDAVDVAGTVGVSGSMKNQG